MADIVTLDTTKSPSDFTITEQFRAGYLNGRDSVDEMSRETSREQGLEDGAAGKPASYDPEVQENLPSVAVSSDEQAAYGFGWDLGWRDEVQDEYRRGYAEDGFGGCVRQLTQMTPR
ncbi:hypothetical protein [Bradyrhizobium liaoningense]|uniref:hypothetical protein n=1 Tax=Bradyrhizobium liaoningense TaxID=43992 RepID=UPI0004B2CF69|nr:hypothetical protein [Bradyrhizobium liaoningense]